MTLLDFHFENAVAVYIDLNVPNYIIEIEIFAALMAKSDIDLIALDKGEIETKEVCDTLMSTLCEYANTGFALMKSQMDKNTDGFLESDGLMKFIQNFCI